MGSAGCVQSEVCGGWNRREVLLSQGEQWGLTRVDTDIKPSHSPIKQPTGLRSWLCHWPDDWTSYLTSLSLCFPVCKMGTTQGVPAARAVGSMRPRLTARGQPVPVSPYQERQWPCSCPGQDGAPFIPRVLPSLLSPSDFHPVPNSEGAHWQGLAEPGLFATPLGEGKPERLVWQDHPAIQPQAPEKASYTSAGHE